MTVCYIGLGSNLGNPEQQIQDAISALGRLHASELILSSSLYRSRPQGPADQPDFINAVVAIKTTLTAPSLLNELQKIEKARGRVRGKLKWGPRTLDLDLLIFGDEIIRDKRLIVPHPEISRRNFVLHPLFEIAENLEIPDLGALKDLLDSVGTDGLQKLG